MVVYLQGQLSLNISKKKFIASLQVTPMMLSAES